MGIDIYAKWRNQTEEEHGAQITGFDTTKGEVGYLREAYHGSPYVTKYLVAESFDHDRPDFDSDLGVPIEAKVMRERLPAAVLLSLYRAKKVYGEGDAGFNFNIESEEDMKKLTEGLANIFLNEVTDTSHEGIVAMFTEEHLKLAEMMIESGALPDYVKSFIEFVDLCEEREKKQGEPCFVYASY